MVGMTEGHDYWRFRVGVPLASWHTGIAANAQAYASTCPSSHSSAASRQNVAGFGYLGENIYYHSSQSADPLDAVASWASERAKYDFGTVTGGTSAVVGHYTQIVWESSTAIGCGVGRCPGSWGTIVVCQYGPGGNYTGQAPYGWSEGDCLDLDNDNVLQRDDADDTDRNVQ
jgi:pathogenesis-related protein 1